MSLLGSIGGALLGGVPNIISGIAGILGGNQQNKAAAEQASAQRAWEEHMSNTSWQRGTADMKAAGINPMLSFMQGGASTPSSSAAPVVNPEAQLGDAMSSMASSALQGLKMKGELALLNAQVQNASAQAGKAAAENVKLNQETSTPGAVDSEGKPLQHSYIQNVLESQANSAQASAAYSQEMRKIMQIQEPAFRFTGSKFGGIMRTLAPAFGPAARLTEGAFFP